MRHSRKKGRLDGNIHENEIRRIDPVNVLIAFGTEPSKMISNTSDVLFEMLHSQRFFDAIDLFLVAFERNFGINNQMLVIRQLNYDVEKSLVAFLRFRAVLPDIMQPFLET